MIPISVEPLVISSLVEQGTLKPAFQRGIEEVDFDFYADEFKWLARRQETKKPISRRAFTQQFPDFEYVVSKDSLNELLDELKNEKAYSKLAALLQSASETLQVQNAVDIASHMRDVLADVVKLYAPHSDVSLKNFNQEYYNRVRDRQRLSRAGKTVGMTTGVPTLDFHWDGLVAGRFIALLGRPGSGKSLVLAKICWEAIKNGYNIGMFSPEMSEDEHLARIHTLASAEPWVQEQANLKGPFLNRDIMRGTLDIKRYKRFLDFFESLPGEARLFTKKFMKARMTAMYIETSG